MTDWQKHAVIESIDDYHKHQALSKSRIAAILKSPLHYKTEWIDGFRDEPTEALRFGSICHAAILEPQRFQRSVRISPECDRRTKEGKALYAEFQTLLAPDSIVISSDDATQITGMIESVRSHKSAANLLEKGIAEHSFYFTDPPSGLPCKFRPDWLTEDGWLVDLKTTTDASLDGFTRQLSNYKYDISAALSCWGFKQIFGQDPKGYVFIAVEKKRPWACSVFVCDAIILEKGGELMREGINKYKQCVETNHWPGYSEEAMNISLAPWRYQYES